MINLLNCGAFSFGKDHARHNEDAFLLPMPCEDGYIFAIADGVGAYAGAQDASKIAISSLTTLKFPDLLDPEFVLNFVKNKITELIVSNSDKIKAATTLSYCFINNDYLYVIHVGDTRVYVKSGLKLKLLTKDHTQHQELLDDGLYTKKELKSLPGKNMLTAALSNSLPLRYQYCKFPLNDLISDDESLMLVIMSDGAHHFWEHRPRFSASTMTNPSTFATTMLKRIQRMGPSDDYSLIAASFQRSRSE